MEGGVKRIGGGVEVTPQLEKEERRLALNKEKGKSKQEQGQCVRRSDMDNSSASSRNRKKRRQAATTTCFQNMDSYSVYDKMFSLDEEEDKENTPLRGASCSGSALSTPSVSGSLSQEHPQPRRVKRSSREKTTPRSKRHHGSARNRAGDKEVTNGQIAGGVGGDMKLGDQRVEGRWSTDHQDYSKHQAHQYNNALAETVGYLEERQRRVKSARNMRKLEVNVRRKDMPSFMDLSGRSKVKGVREEKSVELSLGNYSKSVVHEDLPSKIFSQSVLEKLSINSINEEKSLNVSSQQKVSSSNSIKLSLDKTTSSSANGSVMRCEELLSNQGSIHQLSSLSGPNKAPSQAANHSSSSTTPASTDLLSLSYISAITDLATDSHEQASSLDLAASNVQLHSTFSYPLHSTFRVTEPSFILAENSGLSAGGCVKTSSFNSTTSSSSQKNSIASSIGLNEADMLMSSASSAGSSVAKDISIAKGMSVNAVIRDAVKEVVHMDTTAPHQRSSHPEDFNNNKSLKSFTSSSSTTSSSKLTLSMLSTRKPGDGSDAYDLDNGVLNSSCDSSTLSICVDDESFEGDAGDATYTGPAPDGNCDVCKIMKRQKASLNLNCNNDSESSDKDNSKDGSQGIAVQEAPQPSTSPLHQDVGTFSSKLSTPHRQVLEQCIQQAKAALRKYSPTEQYSPSRWISKDQTPPKRSLRRSSHRDSDRESYRADGSSVCYKSAVSMDSQDSGRGSSYFSDTVSIDSSCHGNQREVWHSTPFGHRENKPVLDANAKPVLRYNMGTTELKQSQGGIPFSLHVDPENFNTPKPCKKIKTSLEKGLRDSTGKYLNTPVSKSAKKSRVQSWGNSGGEDVENCDFDKRAIKKKLKKFCKNFQQENAFANLQSLGSV